MMVSSGQQGYVYPQMTVRQTGEVLYSITYYVYIYIYIYVDVYIYIHIHGYVSLHLI